MRQKILTSILILYLFGAFADYLAREGFKKGLWDNILWRDGGPPLVSLAKGLLWPIRLLTDAGPSKTTAEQLVDMLQSVNSYPLCGPDGCIQEIKAKGNTVIATYSILRSSQELPSRMLIDRAATAEKIRPDFLREVCGAAQADFPDKSMKWAGHYYTSDGKFLASVVIGMNECLSI